MVNEQQESSGSVTRTCALDEESITSTKDDVSIDSDDDDDLGDLDDDGVEVPEAARSNLTRYIAFLRSL